MFSDAISSISLRWRPSSLAITSAISGSACAKVAEKNGSSPAAAALVADIQQLLESTIARAAIAYRLQTAKTWATGQIKPTTSGVYHAFAFLRGRGPLRCPIRLLRPFDQPSFSDVKNAWNGPPIGPRTAHPADLAKAA